MNDQQQFKGALWEAVMLTLALLVGCVILGAVIGILSRN
jgi:ABC-type proline/glycine betaine transport system permease subunit